MPAVAIVFFKSPPLTRADVAPDVTPVLCSAGSFVGLSRGCNVGTGVEDENPVVPAKDFCAI